MGSLHLSESKKNAQREGAVIVFTDEATFRQTPTLHATWSRRGCQPKIATRGERHSQKIFGAVRLETAEFTYLHHQENFQWETYLAFLDQVVLPAFGRRGRRVYLIQDNAGYHKKAEIYDWFSANRRRVEVFNLPPYWPQLNAAERVWHYTRVKVTHNRFFESSESHCKALVKTFEEVRKQPHHIDGLIAPFR